MRCERRINIFLQSIGQTGLWWPVATQRWARETSRRQDSTSKQLILHTSISTASVRWINFSLVQQHLGLVLHPVVDGVGVGLHQALGHHPGPELVAEQLVGDQDLGGNCKHHRKSSSANVIFAAQSSLTKSRTHSWRWGWSSCWRWAGRRCWRCRDRPPCPRAAPGGSPACPRSRCPPTCSESLWCECV